MSNGSGRKIHSEELYNLYCRSDIMTVNKSWMNEVCSTHRKDETCIQIVSGKTCKEVTIARFGCWWEDAVNWDVWGIGCEVANPIHHILTGRIWGGGGSCESGKTHLGSLRDGKFLDQQRFCFASRAAVFLREQKVKTKKGDSIRRFNSVS
jgi:hypothetical protein